MIRWYATTEPQQHLLPAVADRASGTFRTSENQTSKPAPREAPTSA